MRLACLFVGNRKRQAFFRQIEHDDLGGLIATVFATEYGAGGLHDSLTGMYRRLFSVRLSDQCQLAFGWQNNVA